MHNNAVLKSALTPLAGLRKGHLACKIGDASTACTNAAQVTNHSVHQVLKVLNTSSNVTNPSFAVDGDASFDVSNGAIL